MPLDRQNDTLVSAIASQEDAALVVAMAREAADDAGVIDGAQLTEREARALWTLEASGMGKDRS